MFFTLEQIRYNRESDRRRQAFVEQMQQDFQAERERRHAQQAEYLAWQREYQQQLITLLTRNQQSMERLLAGQEAYRIQQETLLAQNQQINARLLELLERRIGQTDAPSD